MYIDTECCRRVLHKPPILHVLTCNILQYRAILPPPQIKLKCKDDSVETVTSIKIYSPAAPAKLVQRRYYPKHFYNTQGYLTYRLIQHG